MNKPISKINTCTLKKALESGSYLGVLSYYENVRGTVLPESKITIALMGLEHYTEIKEYDKAEQCKLSIENILGDQIDFFKEDICPEFISSTIKNYKTQNDYIKLLQYLEEIGYTQVLVDLMSVLGYNFYKDKSEKKNSQICKSYHSTPERVPKLVDFIVEQFEKKSNKDIDNPSSWHFYSTLYGNEFYK